MSDNYEDMTVAELKALLKEQGLPVSGKKADLIERLSQSAQEEDSEVVEDVVEESTDEDFDEEDDNWDDDDDWDDEEIAWETTSLLEVISES